jgi:hypothetical protein
LDFAENHEDNVVASDKCNILDLNISQDYEPTSMVPLRLKPSEESNNGVQNRFAGNILSDDDD